MDEQTENDELIAQNINEISSSTRFVIEIDDEYLCKSNITLVHDILSFEDEDEFNNVIACLEEKDDLWIELFLAKYGHLDDDELADVSTVGQAVNLLHSKI